MAEVDKIGEFLGPFGKWQLKSTLLVFLVKIPSAWFMACLIFTAKSPLPGEIFCKPPFTIIENNIPSWIEAAHPKKYSEIENEITYDVCKIRSNAIDIFLQNSTSNQTGLVECHEFDYQPPSFYSLILRYELFCSREVLVAVTQSFHLLGVLIGGIIANHMLKSVSPKRTMLIGMISQIVLGLATGYAPTYLLHIIFRAAVAATCSLMCIGSTTLADITGGKPKVVVACLFEQYWSIGVILLPLVSTFWESWSIIYIDITAPTAFLMLTYFWLPDSPRWLLKHGRVDEALNVMLEAAKVNGKTDFNKEDLEKDLQAISATLLKAPPEPSLLSIWKGDFKHKLAVLAAHLGWSAFLSLYYASTLHVRAMGRNYLEINTVIIGIAEIIGTFIGLHLILNTTRKWFWASALNIIAAFIEYSAIIIPSSIDPFTRMIILMATSTVAKITISTTLSLFLTCTSEVTGEKAKKRICSYSAMNCARTLVMLAPYIGYSAIHGSALYPQSIMALINVLASLMIASCINTPRTLPLKVEKDDENKSDCTRL